MPRFLATMACLVLAPLTWAADSKNRGPLAGLPGEPGKHVEKIKQLKDNSWLELGTPAADPKWGRAYCRRQQGRRRDLGISVQEGEGVTCVFASLAPLTTEEIRRWPQAGIQKSGHSRVCHHQPE